MAKDGEENRIKDSNYWPPFWMKPFFFVSDIESWWCSRSQVFSSVGTFLVHRWMRSEIKSTDSYDFASLNLEPISIYYNYIFFVMGGIVRRCHGGLRVTTIMGSLTIKWFLHGQQWAFISTPFLLRNPRTIPFYSSSNSLLFVKSVDY